MGYQLNFLVTISASSLIPLKETLNSPLSPSATSIAPDLSLILKLLVTCTPSMVEVFIRISQVSIFIPVLVAAKAPWPAGAEDPNIANTATTAPTVTSDVIAAPEAALAEKKRRMAPPMQRSIVSFCNGKPRACLALRDLPGKTNPRASIICGCQPPSQRPHIGKDSFHVVGHDACGAMVLRQKWSRGQMEARLANIPPCLIGLEACVGAHHLSRKLASLWRSR